MMHHYLVVLWDDPQPGSMSPSNSSGYFQKVIPDGPTPTHGIYCAGRVGDSRLELIPCQADLFDGEGILL